MIGLRAAVQGRGRLVIVVLGRCAELAEADDVVHAFPQSWRRLVGHCRRRREERLTRVFGLSTLSGRCWSGWSDSVRRVSRASASHRSSLGGESAPRHLSLRTTNDGDSPRIRPATCSFHGRLLDRGTRFVWVIRLTEPRHVEVHEPHKMMRHVSLDGVLEAPGILKHSVPVRALFDREFAHELVLRNLVQRKGFADFEDVGRQGRHEGRVEGFVEGRREGRAEGLRQALTTAARLAGIAMDEARQSALDAMGPVELEQTLQIVMTTCCWPE